MSKVTFELCKEKDERLSDYFRIRYERYVEDMKAESLNESGMEIDEYDRSGACLYVIILRDNKVIGGCRLIDRQQTPLPVEQFVFPEFMGKLPERCAEISRYTISRDIKLSLREKVEIQKGLNDFLFKIGILQGRFSCFCANIRASCLRWQKMFYSTLRVEEIGRINFHPGAGKLIPVLLLKK